MTAAWWLRNANDREACVWLGSNYWCGRVYRSDSGRWHAQARLRDGVLQPVEGEWVSDVAAADAVQRWVEHAGLVQKRRKQRGARRSLAVAS